jgi:hypothetical protein
LGPLSINLTSKSGYKLKIYLFFWSHYTLFPETTVSPIWYYIRIQRIGGRDPAKDVRNLKTV